MLDSGLEHGAKPAETLLAMKARLAGGGGPAPQTPVVALGGEAWPARTQSPPVWESGGCCE